jgi:predicted nucleic acid-binding protein
MGNTPIIMGDLILTEVLQGFQRDKDYKTARDLLLRIPFMPMGGQDIALESAANYRLLRRKGITVRKTIDVMIGTFCIHYQLPLLHDDRDFDPMVKYLGLKVIQT